MGTGRNPISTTNTSRNQTGSGYDIDGTAYNPSDFTNTFTDDDLMGSDYYAAEWSTLQQFLEDYKKTQPTSGGSSYGNISAMLQGLGSALGPQQAPQLQQLNAPMLQNVAAMPELQQLQAYQLPEFQQFTPQLLQYQDFSPMQQSLTDVAASTRGQIEDAFAPVMARMAQQRDPMVGNVTPTAQALSPELAQLAQVQGIGSEYQQAMGAANAGIQNNAELFAGRNAMLNDALRGARDMTQATAQMSQGAALSNAAMQEQLANAALQRMIMQSNAGIDQQNNALTNQAGMSNTQGLNDWAMAQATINNNANTANTNLANQSSMAQWDAQNNVAGANTNAMNQWLAANNEIANQQAIANANAAQPNVDALLQMIIQAASMGQTIDPAVLALATGGMTA
jgi:hypothetical protein